MAKYVLFRNCQASAVRWIIETCPDFKSDYENVTLPPSYELTEESASYFCNFTLPTLDIVLMQPHSPRRGHWYNHRVISEQAAQHGVKVVKFPQVHFSVYNPFEILAKAAPQMSEDDQFVYTDGLLLQSVLQNEGFGSFCERMRSGDDRLRKMVLQAVDNSFHFMTAVEVERECDFTLSGYFQRAFRSKRLMHNLNHPGAEVMKLIADGLLSAVNPSFNTTYTVDLFQDHDTIIYPFVADVLDLEFDPGPIPSERYELYKEVIAKADPELVSLITREVDQHFQYLTR